jgi:nicotinate-nucleotide adenylyltransferase
MAGMSKLCLGGAFNPIHHGHLLCARAAAEALGYHTVVLIPTGNPYGKAAPSSMAPAADRLAMCRLAVGGLAGFEVDDRETRRVGPTYTIDTVRQLKSEGWETVPWLIGADQAMNLPSWHEPVALLEEADLLVMTRPGCDASRFPSPFEVLKDRLVRVPALDISSTDIRDRVAADRAIEFLTPAAICRFIAEHGLYKP